MKNLVEMQLFDLFRIGQTSEIKEDDLIVKHREFAKALKSYCLKEANNLLLMQNLGYAQVEFLYFQERYANGDKKKYARRGVHKQRKKFS